MFIHVSRWPLAAGMPKQELLLERREVETSRRFLDCLGVVATLVAEPAQCASQRFALGQQGWCWQGPLRDGRRRKVRVAGWIAGDRIAAAPQPGHAGIIA